MLGLRSIRHCGHRRHERDHHGRAESISSRRPFAILALKEKRSSLVWTEKRDEAARSSRSAKKRFTTNSSSALPDISGESQRRGATRARFPPSYFVARVVIGERLAFGSATPPM